MSEPVSRAQPDRRRRSPVRLRSLLHGLASYVPGVERVIHRPTHGTDSARYCYAVWLRHLVLARAAGLSDDPRVVAELGPGDSLGIGLAALLTGADRYVALDIVPYANASRDVAILDELVALFRERAAIPTAPEFPDLRPALDSYEFPASILTPERLARGLADARVAAIRRALTHVGSESGGITISYRVPWHDASVIERDSIDMVYSQAVMEHVDEPAETYVALAEWLKPGGVASHVVGLGAHAMTPDWNGHWGIPDALWTLTRGRRPYLLNRVPATEHLRMMERSGVEIRRVLRACLEGGIERERLAPRFRDMSDDDLATEALFVQAVKV
jgi:SAM-dependent methyltransferase